MMDGFKIDVHVKGLGLRRWRYKTCKTRPIQIGVDPPYVLTTANRFRIQDVFSETD